MVEQCATFDRIGSDSDRLKAGLRTMCNFCSAGRGEDRLLAWAVLETGRSLAVAVLA